MQLARRWNRAVRHYVKLLRLTHWDVYTEVAPLEGGRMAECQRLSETQQVRVSLSPEAHFGEGVRETRKGTEYPSTLDVAAAHEVLHILFDRTEEIVREAEAVLGSSIFRGIYEKEHERNIDGLAQVLAKTSPSGV